MTNYIMMAPAAEVLLVHQEDGDDGGDGDECQNEVGEKVANFWLTVKRNSQVLNHKWVEDNDNL